MGTQYLESEGLTEAITCWTPSGTDRYGEVIWNSPIELMVRWEHGINFAQQPDTLSQTVRATVFLDQSVPLRSMLWRGAVADLPGDPSPLYEVLDRKETPDLKGRRIWYELAVGLLGDELNN